MAIQFLNSVNLNQNQLVKAAIENQVNNAAAGTGVEGQLYMDTTLHVLKVFASGSWVEVGGGVTTFTATSGTFITFTPVTSQTGAVTLTGNLSATGTPSISTYLRGDNTWTTFPTIPAAYTGWTLAGSSGTPQTILSGATASFAAGTSITTTASATNVLTIAHANTTRADTTSVASPALGATFTVVDSVTTAATGHVTAINVKTITLPTTAVTQASGDSSTNIATTAFVQAATTGLLEFKGGVNASTGAIASGPNAGLFLWGATRIAIAVGDYYIVTVGGNFYGNAATPLTSGDSVIAWADKAANTSTEADWAVVQSDTDIATISTIGLGNVNAGSGIAVSYTNGTATVSTLSTNKKLTLSVATGITKATAGGVTTFTLNLATAWAAGILASNVTCEVIDATTFLTVYAEVGRTSAVSNNLTIAMTGTIADGLYYVLLQNLV